jgi:hypothetical protein
VHVDRALLDEHVVAPHLVEQLRAAVHALRMRHEEVQQLELGRADLHLASPATVTRRVAGSSSAPRLDRGSSASARAGAAPRDARLQLARRERLGE